MTEFFKAAPSIVIAGIVAWIALQQYRTARNQLRLNLYEKRFKVYDGLRRFLKQATGHANVQVEDFSKLHSDTAEAEFLFGEDVVRYLQMVREKGTRLRILSDILSDPNVPIGDERNKAAEEDAELLQWFSDQFVVSAKVFGPYLDFRNIRA